MRLCEIATDYVREDLTQIVTPFIQAGIPGSEIRLAPGEIDITDVAYLVALAAKTTAGKRRDTAWAVALEAVPDSLLKYDVPLMKRIKAGRRLFGMAQLGGLKPEAQVAFDIARYLIRNDEREEESQAMVAALTRSIMPAYLDGRNPDAGMVFWQTMLDVAGKAAQDQLGGLANGHDAHTPVAEETARKYQVLVRAASQAGCSKQPIAEAFGVSRPWVYQALGG
ncbi:hypothetical protein [Mobiluncus curtisii]|uniref:hypothetical protein n=1 Tax=Mobiluncus curtisii TaxID=2051 RepID=UPI0014707263|nr:hypothetical protein [Mobiluncus curtisii]NMW49011.1 hypothetical protein [Mobiluncus curtisii]